MKKLSSPPILFILSLAAIAFISAIGPAEKSLGANVRVVYLHGVWVWAALAGFITASGLGLAGLIARQERFHHWSRAAGRTGLFFWITYLPISLWAMETNWNGLFLAEPRWRLALAFAAGGLVLQAGIAMLEDPMWASAANLVYGLALLFALQNTEQVMHPASPIMQSNAWRIQVFFGGLLSLTLLAAWQVARWWYQFEGADAET